MSKSRTGSAEYDSMKSMLNIMREHVKNNKKSTNSNLLNEEDSQRQLTSEEIKLEQDEFQKAVAINTDFGELKLYSDNATWDGVILPFQISWTFSLEDQDGIYITVNTFQLRDDAFEILQKLKAYYLVWRDKWEKEIKNVVGGNDTI